jgi:hypothetical protein
MESKEHKELKDRAIEYLFNKSHWITNVEVDCGYYGIYDVWGIRRIDLKTMGIEVKISKADFRNNKRKEAITNSLTQVAANENYILCPSYLVLPLDIDPRWGLLWFNGERIQNIKKAPFIEMATEKKLEICLQFLASRQNKNNP